MTGLRPRPSPRLNIRPSPIMPTHRCGQVRGPSPAEEALHREAGRAPCPGRQWKRSISGRRMAISSASARSRAARSRATCSWIALASSACCWERPWASHSSRAATCCSVTRRLRCRCPMPAPDDPMASHTISTAQASAGWTWDIGLPTRRGVGLRLFKPPHQRRRSDRRIAGLYRAGGQRAYPPQDWHSRRSSRNLLEEQLRRGRSVSRLPGMPLESSAIVLVELSAKLIAEQMPANRGVMDIVARRFNEVSDYRWGRIIDFLKLHYVLTKRPEKFWQDNTTDLGHRTGAPEGPAASVEVPAALVPGRIRPAGRSVSGGKLSICAVR